MKRLNDLMLADLHCHILPHIDDGPSHERESFDILKREYQDGIREVALTSHYDCEETLLNDFIEKREKSFQSLKMFLMENVFTEDLVSMKKAAEVKFSPNLCNINLKPLCIEGTNFMLLELPYMKSSYLDKTIFHIQSCGITPIIAHVERYPYMMDDLSMLYSLIEKEVIIQMNANTILNNKFGSKKYLKLIKWNLVHILASDAHSIKRRPPNLSDAIKTVSNCLGKSAAEDLCWASHLIFNGIHPEFKPAYYPKRILGRWI